MMARPIFRPTLFLRAVCRMTSSLTGNTVPAKPRAILYFGHSVIVTDLMASRGIDFILDEVDRLITAIDKTATSAKKARQITFCRRITRRIFSEPPASSI